MACLAIALGLAGCTTRVDVRPTEVAAVGAMIEQGLDVESAQGTVVRRRGPLTESFAYSYVSGRSASGRDDWRFQAQRRVGEAGNLLFRLYGIDDGCRIDPRVFDAVAGAASEVYAKGAGAYPDATVVFRFLAPGEGISRYEVARKPGHGIQLTYYFPCRNDDTTRSLLRATMMVMHELTHAAFQARGRGNGSEQLGVGAARCFYEALPESVAGFPKAELEHDLREHEVEAYLPQNTLGGKVSVEETRLCPNWIKAMHGLVNGRLPPSDLRGHGP